MNTYIELLRPYFAWIEQWFGHLAGEANRAKVSADAIAESFLSNPQRYQRFKENLPHLISRVNDFWDTNAHVLSSRLKTMPGLKAQLGGDVGPQVTDKIFERVGLYFDTIVVPDPLHRVSKFPPSSARVEYYFLKYGIIQAQLAPIYLADVVPPIAFLIADASLLDPGPEKNIQTLSDLADLDAILIVNKMYGMSFQDINEAKRHLSKFSSVQEAIREAKNTDFLYFDERVAPDPLVQYEAILEAANRDFNSGLPQGIDFFLFALRSRMMQVTDVLDKSHISGYHPLVTAPVSFHWLTTKLNLNHEAIAEASDIDIEANLALTNAMLSNELEWLSNIGVTDLIELRAKGKLADLRSTISAGINTLSDSSIENLDGVARAVDYSISSALANHQSHLNELKVELNSELRILGGTLALPVLAAIVPAFAALIPAWVGGIIGASRLPNVIQATVKYARERKRSGRTPVGILWSAKKKADKLGR